LKLRVRKARKLGFPNYIDYVYLDRGRLDYTAKEAAVFRDQVRDVIVPFCRELYEKQRERLGVEKLHWYDEALVFPEGNALPIGTKDELVAKARKMYRELSPETGEFFDFMCEHELFDLETRPGKHLGGYCTFLPDYLAPFIFSNFNGTSADVDVLTHEAGHAFQAYLASRTLPLMNQMHSTSEINEIHSMSMEHFTYPWMDGFFGDKADKYRYAHLCSAVTTIPYLVSVDEFQHRVFEDPSMSATERRKVWKEIEEKYLPWRDYDGNEFLEGGGFWMQKQHIFLYPFYYIDYALAQVCAFQFYLKSREDREEAWQGYLKLCRAGGSRGYFELLELAGLMNPFREGTVAKVMDGVKEAIAALESKLG
jgi:M3 family oligoendopeptidase